MEASIELEKQRGMVAMAAAAMDGEVWPDGYGFDVAADVGATGCESGIWECCLSAAGRGWCVRLMPTGERVAFASGTGSTPEDAMRRAELTNAGLRAAGLDE